MNTLGPDEIRHIADLAKLPLSDEEFGQMGKALSETITFIGKLADLDSRAAKVTETHQVSGLRNVFREDVIEEGRILSQKEALRSSRSTYGGYFVVKKVL